MNKHSDMPNSLRNSLQKQYKHVKAYIKEMISEYQGKASWGNLATMLTGIVALDAFCSIGAAIAEYQGKELIYTISNIFTVILAVSAFWEFICLLSGMRIGRLGAAVCRQGGKLLKWFRARPPKCKWGISAGIIMASIAAVLCWKFFYYDKCTTACFSSVVEIYGIPRGVGDPLSQQEKEQQAGYWQIDEYPNQHRIILTYVEGYRHSEIMKKYSSAYSMQLFQTPARVEYDYTVNSDLFHSYSQDSFLTAKENGFRDPVTVSYYDSNGKLLLQLSKEGNEAFTVERYSSDERPQLLNSTLLRIPDGQKAGSGLASQRIETTYNVNGLPAMRRLNQGTSNLYGVNGERYTYDHNNRLTSLCYLDGNGTPVCNKIGVMLITLKYSNDGNLSSVRYYSDENGTEKTEGFYGVFCEKFSYNSSHNLTERRQLDRMENWSYDANGVYRYEYVYAGNTLQDEFYWGLNETPAWNKQCGSHSLHFETGLENGKRFLSVFFDSAGTPAKTANSPGVTADASLANIALRDRSFRKASDVQEAVSGSIVNRPADLDNGMEEPDSGLAETGESTKSNRKYVSVQYIFDNSSLEMKYRDANGNPVINEHGYAMKKTEYDEDMRIILESYADESGTPCFINGGYAAVRHVYENGSQNRIACLKYLDIAGDLTFNTEVGYAWVEYEYAPQDRGEKITRTYYDAENEPCYISDKGYAVIEDLYNENGFLIQELYKNTEGVVTCRRDYMAAEILYEYADDGNLIRERYKDAQGQPVNRADTGYAVVYREFDAGRLSRERYEGYEEQTLCAVPDRTTGFASVTYRYERGKKLEEAYFDTEEKPVLSRKTGCAAVKYEYNSDGQLLAEYYYGIDGEPVLRKDTGCAIARFAYDNVGRRISWRYYGAEGEAVINTEYHCAGMDYVYGEKGHRSEIRYIGPDGALITRDDYGIAMIREEYDDFGNLSRMAFYDEKKHPAIRKDTGYAAYENIYERGRLKECRYLDTEGNPVLCRDGGYAVLAYEYNIYGQCTASRFFGADRKPIISNKYHCAGIERQYDEKGNIVRISYKDLNNTPLNRTDYGVAEIRRVYDEFGAIVRESYLDADGLPAVRKEYGYASCQYFYQDGRRVERRYFDADGSLVLRKDMGYAIIRLTYDRYGQTLSKYYYGTTEEPVVCTDYHCAGFEYDYDRLGNQKEVRYIGPDGLPMNRRDCGVAKVCKEHDALGNLIRERYFDTENNPTVWRGIGYASCSNTYENGRLTETRYLGTDGNLILRNDTGYAVIKKEYGLNGQKTAEYYYDTFEEPVVSTKYHCAGITYAYDARGNQEKLCYLGPDGKALNRDDYGIAVICREYNDRGDLAEESYLDADGKPAVRKEYGYASFHNTYVNGNNVEVRYFDTAGNLKIRTDYGYAIAKNNYDEYGRKISWSFYDENELPVISKQYHCAGFEYGYDEKSNQTEIRYTGLDGELMNRLDSGVARVSRTYDPFENLTKEAYYDVNNDPAVWLEYGYASYLRTYENGTWTETRYFDTNGDPVLRTDAGYALVRLEYDPYGQLIKESYYGIDERPVLHSKNNCAVLENVYDEKGNKAEIYYLGLDGKFINRMDSGIAKRYRKYDSQGRLVGESCFDAAQQPVLRRDTGYASYQNIYADGRLAETRYFDAAGRLTLRKDTGYAVRARKYNNIGQLAAEIYYDENEAFVNGVNGYAMIEYIYDAFGNITERKKYDQSEVQELPSSISLTISANPNF